MKDHVGIYEALVALCMKRANSATVMEEIFGYIEQAKSRTLLEFLPTSPSSCSPETPGQSGRAKRIRELREELNWYFHRTEMAQLRQASRHQLNELRVESQHVNGNS